MPHGRCSTVVGEWERWWPSEVNCPRCPQGAHGTENPQGPTANAESPKEAKQAEDFFDPDKEGNELHEGTESEENPWAGMGMDDDEETLPREQRETDILGKTKKERRLPDVERHPEENPAPRMRWVQRTSASADESSKCGRDIDISSGECTNRQGDGSDGHCTEPEEGGERHRGKRRRIKVGASRAETSDKAGALCGELNDDNNTLGQPVDLEYVLR